MVQSRAYGTGSIYQTKDGRYRGQYIDSQGKRRYFSGKSAAEVEEKLVRFRADEQNSPGTPTLRTFLKEWLDTVVDPGYRPSTRDAYRRQVHDHILPALGEIKLQDLTPALVQQFLSDKGKEGYSEWTVTSLRRTVSSALQHAVDLNLVPYNPARETRGSRAYPKGQPVKQSLEEDDVRRILETAEREGDRFEAAIAIGFGMGLRVGEIVALRWCDFDLKARTLHVRHTMERSNTRLRDDEERLSPTVSSGERILEIPDGLIPILERHFRRQGFKKEDLDRTGQIGEYLFTTKRGVPVNDTQVARHLKDLAQASSIEKPISLRTMRHTFAALMLQKGESLFGVSAFLGHADPSVTWRIYGDAAKPSPQGVMERANELYEREEG